MDDDPIINPGTYDLTGDRTLHVWISGDALWACSAYDHGPMCRLCRQVDGVLNACLQNVLEGRMDCQQRPDGEFEFKMTEAGEQYVHAMIERFKDEAS